MNPKCLGKDFPDTFGARSAHLTGLKMRRITRAVSFNTSSARQDAAQFLRQFKVTFRPFKKLPAASSRPWRSVPTRSAIARRDPSLLSPCMWMVTSACAASDGRLRGGDRLDSQRMCHLCDLFRWIVAVETDDLKGSSAHR